MRPLRCLLVLLIVVLPASPFATTFPVTKTEDTNDGTCDADCSLREAIEAANTNPGADDVPVPAGTYLLTLGQLVVSDDLRIVGTGQTDTVIDGNASDRVLEIQTGVVGIASVTIQNGYSIGDGGGIANYGDLTLTNSTVSGNTANANSYSNPHSEGGGGIVSFGVLTLTNSTVIGNTAFDSDPPWPGYVYMDGGGILSSGTATLTNSTVSSNTANGDGGGIASYGGLALTNSTVSSNTANGDGGGILGGGNGDTTVTNSTVSGNTAEVTGGGILFVGGGLQSSGVLSLTNSTVSGNTSISGSTGGIYLRNTYCSRCGTASFHPDHSIVVENGVFNCGGQDNPWFRSFGYNLTDDTSCGLSQPTDLLVADAMLGPLQDNGGPTETHDLLPGSPAIDAGSMDCPPPDTDQRGVPRPQGSACDIGAVEYLPEPRGPLTLIAGAGFLGFLYRRRRRSPRRAIIRLTGEL